MAKPVANRFGRLSLVDLYQARDSTQSPGSGVRLLVNIVLKCLRFGRIPFKHIVLQIRLTELEGTL